MRHESWGPSSERHPQTLAQHPNLDSGLRLRLYALRLPRSSHDLVPVPTTSSPIMLTAVTIKLSPPTPTKPLSCRQAA